MITLNFYLFILSVLCACGFSFIIGIIVGGVCFPQIQPPPPPEKDFDRDPATRNS